MFWTNRNGRRHPDDRRAGCPHPAGPCGGANAPVLKLPRCGGRERPPYGAGENAAANRKIAAAQTPAGGYGIRPYGRWQGPRPNKKPQPCGIANPRRGRFHIGPDRGGAGFPGRDESRPYGRWQGPRPNKKPQPCGIANPRRGRFHIGPDRGGAGFPGRDLRPKSRRCAAVDLRNAPAGAVNPAPTNKFYVLNQLGRPPPPGRP